MILPIIGTEEDTHEEEEVSDTAPPPTKKQPPPPPFIVGEGLPVIPSKLVQKIQKGEFIDMAELLKDNIEADRRRTTSAGSMVASILASTRPRREVPDLMGWVQCFGIYASILSESHPNLSKGLWAYQTFIVREARRSNGRGWQEYDAMFRQQQASAADLRWGSVNNALYAVTFAAPQPTTHERSYHRATTVCRWCQEPDHQSVECALAQNLPNQDRSQRGLPTEPRRNTRQLGSLSSRACYAWNTGKCHYGSECRFHHVCSVKGCGGAHRANECRLSSKNERRQG